MIVPFFMACALATSTVESPDRDTLFDLDPPVAAATGAAIAGGGAWVIAFAGAALMTVSPVFVLLPIVATIGLPVASAFGAVFGANLSDSAVSVGMGAGGGVLGGGIVGAAAGLAVGALVDESAALVGAWMGGMIGGTAGGAAAAAVLTELNE